MLRGFDNRAQRRCIVSLLVAASVSLASSAWALSDSDKEAVRRLSNEAVADFNAERFAVARDKFMRAYEVARVPRLAVWIARASERTKQLVSAYEYYRQAARLEQNELWVGDVQQQAQRDAETELAVLTPRLPRLVIGVGGARPSEVEVRVDEAVVPPALVGVERFVDPGKHEVTGSWQGKVVRESVIVDEGAKFAVELRFDLATSTLGSASATAVRPTPSDSRAPVTPAKSHGPLRAGSTQRTWGWVTLGVGAAGLATGLGAGAVVAAKYKGLDRDCANGVCPASEQSRVESYRTMRLVSTVGFVVGAVGAATGVTLLLLAPNSTSPTGARHGIELWASAGMVGANGTF